MSGEGPDVEEGEIQSEGEEEGELLGVEKKRNEKQLLSNQERINRLYSMFANNEDSNDNNTPLNQENWSTETSPRKVEKSNRSFQKAISGVLSPSHYQKRISVVEESNEIIHESDFEDDSHDHNSDRRNESRGRKRLTKHSSQFGSENTNSSKYSEFGHSTHSSYRTLSSPKAKLMGNSAELTKFEGKRGVKEDIRRIADTLAASYEATASKRLQRLKSEDAMDLESSEEGENLEGGVPILFGSETTMESTTEDEKSSPKTGSGAKIVQRPPVPPTMPVFNPQVQFQTHAMPVPPFPFWTMPNVVPQNRAFNQKAPLNHPSNRPPPSVPPPLPPMPPLPTSSMQRPPLPKFPPPSSPQQPRQPFISPMSQASNQPRNDSRQSLPRNFKTEASRAAVPNTGMDFRRPSLLPTPSDVDYRSLSISQNPQGYPAQFHDVDMRNHHTYRPEKLSVPPFKKPAIRIAPLGNALLGNQPTSTPGSSTGTDQSRLNIPGSSSADAATNMPLTPNFCNADNENKPRASATDNSDYLLEDENLRLWQEAVASMAHKRKAKRSSITSASTSSGRTRRPAFVSEHEKAHSPPLIVPIEDEIQVVEIARSPSEGLVEISADEDGAESSEDEEIELLELRREAMKTMVEKEKPPLLDVASETLQEGSSSAIVENKINEKSPTKLEGTLAAPVATQTSTVGIDCKESCSIRDQISEPKSKPSPKEKALKKSSDPLATVTDSNASKVTSSGRRKMKSYGRVVVLGAEDSKLEKTSIQSKLSDLSITVNKSQRTVASVDLKASETNLEAMETHKPKAIPLLIKAAAPSEDSLRSVTSTSLSDISQSHKTKSETSKITSNPAVKPVVYSQITINQSSPSKMLPIGVNNQVFQKINNRPAELKVIPSSFSLNNKVAPSVKLSPGSSLVTKRRIKRPSMSSSTAGRVAKPVAKAVVAKSIQLKLVRSQSAMFQKKGSKFSLVAKPSSMNRKRESKNPFSKINLKRVNSDVQAPKHPPLVISMNLHESSEEEEENTESSDVFVNQGSLSDSDVSCMTNVSVPSQVLSGKHITSMFSWKPPSEVTPLVQDAESRRIRTSINPFARKKFTESLKSMSDPFAETPRNGLMGAGNAESLSDSELSVLPNNSTHRESALIEYDVSRSVGVAEISELSQRHDEKRSDQSGANIFELFDRDSEDSDIPSKFQQFEKPSENLLLPSSNSSKQVEESSLVVQSAQVMQETIQDDQVCATRSSSQTPQKENTVPSGLNEMLHKARMSASRESSRKPKLEHNESQPLEVSEVKFATESPAVRHQKPLGLPEAAQHVQNQTSFSNAVLLKFRKQLLFVKSSRDETEAAIVDTRKQLKRTQSKLVDAGQLATDLKKQLATVHVTIDTLRKTAGECDRKLLELQQKEKAMLAFEKQLLQKMTIAEREASMLSTAKQTLSMNNKPINSLIISKPEQSASSETKNLETSTLLVLNKHIPHSNQSQSANSTPVRLMAKKTIVGSSGKRKRTTSVNISKSITEAEVSGDVKAAKLEKTKPKIDDMKTSLAAELEATNQKLAQMRSAVVASGQSVPAWWKTNRPKWHRLSRVSRSIVKRGYVPVNVAPSKLDLQKSNLKISSEVPPSSANTEVRVTTVAQHDSQRKITGAIRTGENRDKLAYGSKAVGGITSKHLQSNPAVLLASMKAKLEVYKGEFSSSGILRTPNDSNQPKVLIKDAFPSQNEKPSAQSNDAEYWNGKFIIGAPFKTAAAAKQNEVQEFRLESYESPLASFKSYRFCPNFLFAMRGNEGSTTWSHAIDPFIALCPFDLHGQCSDKLCLWQHSKDYTLTRMQLACDLLAYLHISPESSLFTEQSLQRMESSKKEQFEELQKKLEVKAQQITHNELSNLTRSQLVKDMVGVVNRSRVSSLRTGEPIPEHHVMPGTRAWRPLNSRKRLHYVPDVKDSEVKRKSDKLLEGVAEMETCRRSKEEDKRIQRALESAELICCLTDKKIESINDDESVDDNRYFESTVSCQNVNKLKQLIEAKSGDVTAWVELAKWTEINPQLKTKEEKQKAKLSVLARALEVNHSSLDLWQLYVKEFARASFNSIESVLNLCYEAAAYVSSDFICYLELELSLNIKSKVEAAFKLFDSAVQKQDAVAFIQRFLIVLKLQMLSYPSVTAELVPKLFHKFEGFIRAPFSCHVLSPIQFSFLWLLYIQVHDSLSLPEYLDRHLIGFLPQWLNEHDCFLPFEISWLSESKCDLSRILELFEAAIENVKAYCLILDEPHLEAVFHVKRNCSRLLHFHKEHKRANQQLLETVKSSFTCYFQSDPSRCCQFVSEYAIQTLQFACNSNGIKPTLDPHFERFSELPVKPAALLQLYSKCAEISQNKKWPMVTKYFVEMALKFLFNSVPIDRITALRNLVFVELEIDDRSIPVQTIGNNEKPCLVAILCFHLECEKMFDEAVNVFELCFDSDFACETVDRRIQLWISYLSFLLRFMRMSKANRQLVSATSSVLTEISSNILVLFQKAISQCCLQMTSSQSTHSGCRDQRLERLCQLVLPSLAVEPKLGAVQCLLELFPSNVYLLKIYVATSKHNLRGAQLRCSLALSDGKPCLELLQVCINASLSAEDLSEALKIIRLARDCYPFVVQLWCQEVVVTCCAGESCQDIPKVIQFAQQMAGHDLNEFIAPLLPRKT